MLLLSSPASHPRAETRWPLRQCYKFPQAAAPRTSPKAIPHVRIASHSLNCLSFSPHYANRCPCDPASRRGCPDLLRHSHLGSQLAFTVSVRAAGMKPPFLCQAAAGNLRRHWPTPATSEREAGSLEVIYKNIFNSKKHKWWLRKCWRPKLMSAETVNGLFCLMYSPQERGQMIEKGLGLVVWEASTSLNINYWPKAEMLGERRTASQFRVQLRNLFLNYLCVRVISGTTSNWLEVFHTLGELHS